VRDQMGGIDAGKEVVGGADRRQPERPREVAGVFTSSNVIRTYFNPSAKARYFLNDIYKWTGLRFPG
jgi:hypothetical protein